MKRGHNRRAVPEDFAERCATTHTHGLRQHYKAGTRTVQIWLRLMDLTPLSGVRLVKVSSPGIKRPIPDDFAEVAPKMCAALLVAHYKAGRSTIKRWLAEMPAIARPARGIIRKGRGPSMTAKFDNESNRTSADLAAMHLQRRFAPVCRATVYGAQFAGLWQVGRMRVTEDAMLALACKHGHDRAWAA